MYFLKKMLNYRFMTPYKLINTILEFAAAALFIVAAAFISGCDDDDPVREDTPELITKATLTFTPSAGSAVVVTATDPDGEGSQDLTVDGPITLQTNQTYVLTIQLINELAEPSDPEYDITAEVQEEGDEHMFFFSWTNNVFADPVGDGNIDNRADDVNYGDQDANSLPIGLQTTWTTGTFGAGSFHVVLKHQPQLKSSTSGSSEGETDLDIQFAITIQ
jgi:hypothetical protein